MRTDFSETFIEEFMLENPSDWSTMMDDELIVMLAEVMHLHATLGEYIDEQIDIYYHDYDDVIVYNIGPECFEASSMSYVFDCGYEFNEETSECVYYDDPHDEIRINFEIEYKDGNIIVLEKDVELSDEEKNKISKSFKAIFERFRYADNDLRDYRDSLREILCERGIFTKHGDVYYATGHPDLDVMCRNFISPEDCKKLLEIINIYQKKHL